MAELCNPALQGDPFCKTLEPIGFEHERHRFSVALGDLNVDDDDDDDDDDCYYSIVIVVYSSNDYD